MSKWLRNRERLLAKVDGFVNPITGFDKARLRESHEVIDYEMRFLRTLPDVLFLNSGVRGHLVGRKITGTRLMDLTTFEPDEDDGMQMTTHVPKQLMDDHSVAVMAHHEGFVCTSPSTRYDMQTRAGRKRCEEMEWIDQALLLDGDEPKLDLYKPEEWVPRIRKFAIGERLGQRFLQITYPYRPELKRRVLDFSVRPFDEEIASRPAARILNRGTFAPAHRDFYESQSARHDALYVLHSGTIDRDQLGYTGLDADEEWAFSGL